MIRRRQKPIGPCLFKKELGKFLCALACVARVVEELGDLFVRHDIPDAVRCENGPLGNVTALRMILIRVVGERSYFGFCDYASLFGQDIAQRAGHG